MTISRHQPGDYIIYQPLDHDPNRLFLARIDSVRADTALVVTAEDWQLSATQANLVVAPRMVLANLGANPASGSVFGLPVTYQRLPATITQLGRLAWYRNATPTQIQTVTQAANRVAQQLTQQGLTGILPLDLQLHDPVTGFQAGFKVRDGQPNLLVISPDDCHLTVGVIDYLLYHELGHAIAQTLFTATQRARWQQVADYSRTANKSSATDPEELFCDQFAGYCLIRDNNYATIAHLQDSGEVLAQAVALTLQELGNM